MPRGRSHWPKEARLVVGSGRCSKQQSAPRLQRASSTAPGSQPASLIHPVNCMAVARWRAWLAGPAPALFRWPAAKQLQHKPDPLRARRHGVGSAPLCGPGSGHATRAQGAGARQGCGGASCHPPAARQPAAQAHPWKLLLFNTFGAASKPSHPPSLARLAQTTPPPPRPPGATTRVARNANFGKLQAGYLFPEVRPPLIPGGWSAWDDAIFSRGV
jgi:hypothetical protein